MPKKTRTPTAPRTYKGKDVGKAVFQSFIHDYKNRNNPDYTPLFTQEAFDRMTRSLSTEHDRQIYTQYVTLYNGVIEEFNRAQGAYQQAQNGYNRILMHLRNVQQAESARQIASSIPRIVTPRQYRALQRAALAVNKRRVASVNDIALQALDAYIAPDGTRAGNIPPTIDAALQTLARSPAEGTRALRHMNRALGLGYYRLADGSRSDRLSAEDWTAALDRAFADAFGPPDAQVKGPGAQALHRTLIERALRQCREADTVPSDPAAQDTVFLDAPTQSICDWHPYTYPPSGLYRQDLLWGPYAMRSWYADHPDAFAQDFPALHTALHQDIDARLSLRGRTELTWGELAKANVYGYAQRVRPTVEDLSAAIGDQGLPRHPTAGFAVLQMPENKAADMDGQGNYSDPLQAYPGLFIGLDDIANTPALQADLAQARDALLIPALRSIAAYNAVLRIIQSLYDIPDLTALENDLSTLLAQIHAYNRIVRAMWDGLWGTPEEIHAKQSSLRTHFPPVDLSKIDPDPAVEARVESALQNPMAFTGGSLQRMVIELATARNAPDDGGRPL